MIASSKNPNLFPHLNIPRTTALYWISRRHSWFKNDLLNEEEREHREILEEQENRKLKVVNYLLRELLQSSIPNVDLKNCSDPNIKEKLVNLVESVKEYVSKRAVLYELGISQTTYYRWRSEVLGCEVEKIKCDSSRANQLSLKEQEVLVKLAKDERLKQLSTKSLMYYAQREGLLNCSIDSWYKYMKIYKVSRRVGKPHKKRHCRDGIRAKNVNEIWHIDVTHFKTRSGRNLYVQLIVDNYSRAIVNFRVSETKNSKITLKNLLSVLKENHRPRFLMSDGGGENCNLHVREILLGKGVTQLVAKSNVHFSNSMVEAVFRQLKQKYIEGEVRSKRDLRKKIKRFIYKYNFVHPHSSLGGGTPYEVYQGVWDNVTFKKLLRLRRGEASTKRRLENKRCLKCVLKIN